MAKKSQQKNPGLKWPKTPQAKLQDLQQKTEALGAVAKVGQMLTAASAVPMPLAKKLVSDAASTVAEEGTVGRQSKNKRNRDRARKKHAGEYFESNNAWDEVNGIYLACVDLLKTSLMLTPLLKERTLLQHVQVPSLLARNIRAITRDTMQLNQELGKIYALHEGKAGGSKTPEEMMISCEVFSQYVHFMERYDSALMPLVVHASEQLQEAMLNLNKVNPELANTLNAQLVQSMSAIRGIVHEVTGGEIVPTPVPAAEAPKEEVTAA